jgi:acyl-CoA thioester hydrolase
MPANQPFIGNLLTVEDQWTDYNGHLNMAYYAVLFDRSAEELFESFGLGVDYVKSTNCTTFTLETHTTYANELHAGDKVRIETLLLGADQKRVHYVQQMFRGDTSYLACVLEVIVSHVDLTAKRTSPYPVEIQARINEMVESHKSIPRPPQVGHVIGLPPKR